MKKTLKIVSIIIITIVSLLLLFYGLIMLAISQNKKEMYKKMVEKSKQCNLNLSVEEYLKIDLYNFENSDLKSMKFEIIRNKQSIRDTLILGFENERAVKSIEIPFNNFLRSDTILLTINKKLKYNISDFNYGVGQLYGMFGPVALSDCYLVNSYTINDNQNTNKIIKF